MNFLTTNQDPNIFTFFSSILNYNYLKLPLSDEQEVQDLSYRSAPLLWFSKPCSSTTIWIPKLRRRCWRLIYSLLFSYCQVVLLSHLEAHSMWCLNGSTLSKKTEALRETNVQITPHSQGHSEAESPMEFSRVAQSHIPPFLPKTPATLEILDPD